MTTPIRRAAVVVSLVLTALLGLGATTRPAAAAPKVKDVLALLPDDTTMVTAADVKGSRAATTMATVSAEVMVRSGPLYDLLGSAGGALIDTYVSAKVGTPTYSWAGTIFIVDGAFPADVLSSAKYSALRAERGYDIYTLAHGGVTFEATLKGGRLIIAEGAVLTRVLDLATRSKAKGAARPASTAKAAAPLRAALATADVRATAWAAVVVTGSVATTLAQASMPASWMSVSMYAGADLRVATVLELGDAKVAAATAAATSASLAALGSSVGGLGSGGGASALASVTIVASGTTLRLGVTLTDAELRAGTRMLRTLLP